MEALPDLDQTVHERFRVAELSIIIIIIGLHDLFPCIMVSWGGPGKKLENKRWKTLLQWLAFVPGVLDAGRGVNKDTI